MNKMAQELAVENSTPFICKPTKRPERRPYYEQNYMRVDEDACYAIYPLVSFSDFSKLIIKHNNAAVSYTA